MQVHRALGVHPPHLPRGHGDHEQLARRQPPEAARLVVELHLDPPVAASGPNETHAVGVEVGHPEPAVVPAWALTEVQPLCEHLDLLVHGCLCRTGGG